MRVGLVIYGSLGTLTGGYLYDRRLFEHLATHGDEVEVVSLPWRGYGRHLGDNVSPTLARRLDGGRFDVLLQDELNHPSLVLTNRRLRSRDTCPLVAIVHVLRCDELNASPLRALYAAVERRYLAGIDAAVFCCQATRARAERLLGAPIPGIVAHPGCDHLGPPPAAASVAARASEFGPLRVLSVANVVPRKGLHVLIEALARLPLDRWRLTVAGSLATDAVHVRRVRRLIERTNVGANVELLGSVPNDEVRALLGRADVLALPSFYEGLAIAYLEALRLGVPVIATTAGGAGEVVTHGREGRLVDPGDAGGLAAHLDELARDRALLGRMSLAARRRAERHPTWEQSMSRARELLTSIVRDDRSAAGAEAA
jgi:glycosyltransferase involved in cell wall biosynthesis